MNGEDDPAELPSIPVQRSSAVAGCDRLQPGQPAAAAGAAEGNQIASKCSISFNATMNVINDLHARGLVDWENQ